MTHSVRQMIESSPALLLSTPVYTDNFALTIGGVLNVYSNLTIDDCNLIIKEDILRQIQFAGDRLNNESLQIINDLLLPSRKNVTLKITIDGSGNYRNLDFLSQLSNLKSLTAGLFMSDLFTRNEIYKINSFLVLEELAIGTDRVSVEDIISQRSLKKLVIFEKPKGVEVIEQMPWIKNLKFSSQSFKSLDFIRSLKDLDELHFMGGGTKNLTALPYIGKIKKLSFVWVRKLMIDDLLPINEMDFLKELSFETQPHLTDLEWLKNKNIKTTVIRCKNFKP